MMETFTRDLFVLIVQLTVCMCICAPLVLVYYVKFIRISNLMVIKKRYPKITMVLCKLILFNLLITMPIQAISWSTVLMDYYQIWEFMNRVTFIAIPLTGVAVTYILALKCWHMYYDLNWAMSDRNSVWKYHMDPMLTQCDFWLKHKKTLGSITWTKKYILFPIWLLTTIISTILLQTYGLQFHSNGYYIAHIFTCGCFSSPGFFIGFLKFKIKRCKDNFFLKDEFSLLSHIIFIGVLCYIGAVIVATYDFFIGGLMNYFIETLVFFLLALASTYYIRHKIVSNVKMFNASIEDNKNDSESKKSYKADLGFLFGESGEFGVSLIGQSSPTISANSGNFDGIDIPTFKQISLHSQSVRNSMTEDISHDATKTIKVHHFVTNVAVFEIFMQHLASEFSMELMLTMVTIIQWKRNFYDMYKAVNDGVGIETNQCHHHCPVDKRLPFSDIISKYFRRDNGKSYKTFNSNEELIIAAKKAAHDIFVKYIKTGATLEVNLPDPMRKAVHSICNDLNAFLENNMDIKQLFAIFDAVAEEQYKLMVFSFTRFKSKKHEWSKCVRILSKQSLDQPMMAMK